MTQLYLLFFALAFASVFFCLVFVAARRLDNYAIVDVAWSLGFIPLALGFAWLGEGSWPRKLLVSAMALLWSLRLGFHLGRRVFAHLDREDGRYQQLRRDWAANLSLRMFVFFQFQALVLVLLSLPFLLASSDPVPSLRPLELLAAVLWLLAFMGESLADLQLAAFKRTPGRAGAVCDSGLWSWSRHPNYFFEWLIWVAFALFAFSSPWGWAALACPVLMLFFLLKVTGVRATEEQLLRSKGEAYKVYQARTSAFIPWPPKRASA